jgi:hypothetical protein
LRAVIGYPAKKHYLVSGALTTIDFEFDIIHGVPAADTFFSFLVLALGVQELFSESGPVWVF